MGSSAEPANLKSAIQVVMINQGLDISNKKDIPTDHDETMIDADFNFVHDTLPMDTQSKSKKRTLEKKKVSKSKINKSEVKVERSSGTSLCNMVQNEGKVVVYEPNEEKPVAYKQDDGRIHFTAMLKESGVVFESSASKNPCKFRLGDEKVMEGFNMGIDGMNAESCFGEQELGTSVPPNSWLVYEVELVGVQH
ncbi:peptidyl-prolyl cis-trans isomerase FKBP15-3-like [Sesamum indicum]|uniref:peptidylprolyl isomerase n=1 Tax=Sesamum indicum TaxID=4182 RepID=A0A8M8UXB5_SESIN|nr:peptidyl-prolyl cis-trans isomerase FKBP15-3-like [Sesamum indicum]